jgi:hypothetical protein
MPHRCGGDVEKEADDSAELLGSSDSWSFFSLDQGHTLLDAARVVSAIFLEAGASQDEVLDARRLGLVMEPHILLGLEIRLAHGHRVCEVVRLAGVGIQGHQLSFNPHVLLTVAFAAFHFSHTCCADAADFICGFNHHGKRWHGRKRDGYGERSLRSVRDRQPRTRS